MSKATKKVLKEVKELKREEKRATGTKLLPASASSTGKQKAKVVKRPADAVGSVKTYGTPYNGLNSQVHKFMPSQVQAALMAWAHTVANPRTLQPHPVPIACVPGASASVPQMFKCTLYGTAYANGQGRLFIGANGDGWWPTLPGAGGENVPTPGNQYLTASGAFSEGMGAPVHFTGSTYAGTGVGSGPGYYPGSAAKVTDAVAGLDFAWLPVNFIPNLTGDSRYTNVAVELRARPIAAQLYASGELAGFNYRRTPLQEGLPNGRSFGAILTDPVENLSRERLAAPNWPSNKWLTVVAVPNTATCFGQWLPAAVGTDMAISVGMPMAYIIGEGLPDAAPVEFEATYVYAAYGTRTYTTSGSGGVEALAVDASRAAPVVANGLTMLVPAVHAGTRPDARGAAAVVKAEQQDGRMPSVKDVIGGIKAGKEVFEAVTGSDIGEEIAAVIGDIAAMFL